MILLLVALVSLMRCTLALCHVSSLSGHAITQYHNTAGVFAPTAAVQTARRTASSQPTATVHQRGVKACSFRQEVAQAVLDHVASPVMNSKITQQQSTTTQAANNRTLTEKLAISNQSATTYSSTSNSVTASQLHKYVYHLPSPPVPAAWWQACDLISKAGLQGLQQQLAPDKCALPDVQQAAAAHCQLGRQPWAFTFKDPALSAFAASLFVSIVNGWPTTAKQLGAPAPQLNRFDLFHGHIFVAYNCSSSSSSSNDNASSLQPLTTLNVNNNNGSSSRCRSSRAHGWKIKQHEMHTTCNSSSATGCQVGVLFHASEYPAYDEQSFPIMLGHCQANGSCKYNPRAMDFRNILWWQGQLAVLDVGKNSSLHDLLLHEGTEPLRTLYEEDFGQPVADILLLRPPHHRRRRRMTAELQRWQRVLQAEASAGRHSTCRSTLHHGVFVSH